MSELPEKDTSNVNCCLGSILSFLSRFFQFKDQFIVLQLVQTIPWLVRLARKDDEKLIIEILKLQAMFSRDLTKKQEGQFLKLIEALMQVTLSVLDGTYCTDTIIS